MVRYLMPRSRTPEWARYCYLSLKDMGISSPFVMLRMPDRAMPWHELLRHVRRLMKDDFGIPGTALWSVEGHCGVRHPWPDARDEDEREAGRLDRGFGGDPEILKRWHLYAWDDAKERFVLVRPPVTT